MLILRPPLDQFWKNKDVFDEVNKLSGEVYRSVDTRETSRIDIDGNSYYLKLHTGVELKEILKNALQLKTCPTGAKPEWDALELLHRIGVDTMEGVAFGEKGINPLTKTSFLITKDLSPVISLEDYCKDWKKTPPTFPVKEMILRRLATMVRKMHQAGLNHRDCYICHFLMSLPFDGNETHLKISVIDLHRAQIRKSVPRHYWQKDLIGLFYSATDIGLNRQDFLRFLKIYFESDLHSIFKEQSDFINRISDKVARIRKHTHKRNL